MIPILVPQPTVVESLPRHWEFAIELSGDSNFSERCALAEQSGSRVVPMSEEVPLIPSCLRKVERATREKFLPQHRSLPLRDVGMRPQSEDFA